jgi:malonate transporter and related proteins
VGGLVSAFFILLDLTAPLFVLVGVGFALARWGGWPVAAADALTRFVFNVAIPTLLFRLMSEFARSPRVDAKLLLAYFGGCLLVYVLARIIAWLLFRMDGTAQTIFAMGGIFSNNVLLGVPLAKVTLGDAALPAVSLVLVFNSLLLWTLATASVEWARHREFSPSGLIRTFVGVLRNPVVASILLGTAFGFSGLTLPGFIDQTIALMSHAAVPLSLVSLGMGLAAFSAAAGWKESGALAAVKLVLHPLAVYGLARLFALPPMETAAIVMLASLPIGANVYLMSRQFDVLTGPIASCMVLTTVVAAATTPLVLALIGRLPP